MNIKCYSYKIFVNVKLQTNFIIFIVEEIVPYVSDKYIKLYNVVLKNQYYL